MVQTPKTLIRAVRRVFARLSGNLFTHGAERARVVVGSFLAISQE